jgi:TonB-dependent receptor
MIGWLRHKQTNNQPTSYATLPAISLATAAGSLNNSYYHGIYQNGAEIAGGYLQGILGSGTVSPTTDAISAAQQFLDAHENIYAGYGEYTGTWGKFGLLVGVRVEHTKGRTSAFNTTTDANGNTKVASSPGQNSYTNFFPSVQMKYAFEQSLIARATYSSTIARPGFNQLSAALAVDLGAHTVTLGNPFLKPARSDSFDVTIEKYLGGAGIISAGLFYKSISNYILPNVINDPAALAAALANPAISNYSGTKAIYSFSNAGNAYSRGAEISFDHRFHELPGLLGGLGVSANFTYIDSRVQIRPGEYSRLPSSSQYTYNAAVFYEKGPLNLRLAVYSTSTDLFGIGQNTSGDVYNSARTSMDFGGSFALSKHGALYFSAKNLLNTPHEFYQGQSNRPIQREFYGQTYQIGVRFDY